MKAHRIKCWNLGSDHYLSVYGARGGVQHIPLAGEAIAQGRLIAAAPDLLEVARNLHHAIILGNVTFRTPEIEATAKALVTAAIAKAEGAQ